MVGYAKLFSSIVASTIWNEDAKTCKVWITMLAMKDRDGVVEGSIPGLAVLARVSVKECERAIEILSAPDPHSRTTAKEGRRIEPHRDGWSVINHDVYQERGSLEDKREKGRLRVERHRERRNAPVTLGNGVSRFPCSASASASASEVQKGAASRRGVVAAAPRPEDVSEATWSEWVWHRRQKRASVTAKVLESWRKRATAAGMTLEEAMTYSLAQGHMGFFPPKAAANGKPVTNLPMPNDGRPFHARYNLEVGDANCPCPECVQFRAKKEAQ